MRHSWSGGRENAQVRRKAPMNHLDEPFKRAEQWFVYTDLDAQEK